MTEQPPSPAPAWLPLAELTGAPKAEVPYWWVDRKTGAIHQDDALFDPDGKLGGKAGCGDIFCSHARPVVPADFPAPPGAEPYQTPPGVWVPLAAFVWPDKTRFPLCWWWGAAAPAMILTEAFVEDTGVGVWGYSGMRRMFCPEGTVDGFTHVRLASPEELPVLPPELAARFARQAEIRMWMEDIAVRSLSPDTLVSAAAQYELPDTAAVSWLSAGGGPAVPGAMIEEYSYLIEPGACAWEPGQTWTVEHQRGGKTYRYTGVVPTRLEDGSLQVTLKGPGVFLR